MPLERKNIFMRILSLDTSTSFASVALVSDEKILSHSTFMADRRLSVSLLPEILHLLQLAGITINDIDLFACSIGPGSFTGVRAGVATVQGLALATGKPCVGFSSLSLVAMNFALASLPVCSLLDARKNEVYAALNDCSTIIPTSLVSDCVMPVGNFLDLICTKFYTPFIFCGDGAVRYRDVIQSRLIDRARFPAFSGNTAQAVNGALLALNLFNSGHSVGPEQLLPVYIRATENEYAKLDQQKSRIKA